MKKGTIKKTIENKEIAEPKPLKVWGSGPIKFGEIELDCYILQDGTTVLNKGKMMKAIGREWKGASRTERPNFIGAVNLQPFINPKLDEMLKGVEFYDGGRMISGYHSDILLEVCNVYLEARQAGALTKSQLPIAQTCEILVRAFAKIGLTALIYEQLGFEKYKNPDALRILLESYLSEELRAWSKEFPDEFFFQLDRLYGNERTTSRKRPQYYAKFIRKYIYNPIEKGFLLEELDKRNPKNEKGNRKHRLHQFLNEMKGLNVLRAQIWQVLATLKLSSNKRQYENRYARMMGQSYQNNLFEED